MVDEGVDPKGEILEGSYLVMSGHCRTVYVAEIPDTDFDYNFHQVAQCTGLKNERGRRVCMHLKTANWDSVLSFREDFSDVEAEIDTKDAKEYLCVQIARELKKGDYNPKILALVLTVNSCSNVQTFRRVGLLSFDASEQGQWDKRTLKLV